ncbi:MAG: hypothetical protein H8Z69_00475 [Nanohaloarchaea archaeon]|nr:hypothetical protein [Candidatus Nanohaloarchaea archaeon]
MKMYKILLAVCLLLPSSAALDVKYAEDCGNYEPVISFDSSEAYSHPAEPDFFSNNVCISGIEDSSIGTSCDANTGFYLSSREEKAHFSVFDSYNLNVCTGRMATTTSKGSCPSNSTVLFSVSSKDNAHVSKPSVFDTKICGSYQSPENVTLEMNFNLSSSDTTYFDSQQLSSEKSIMPPADFPYLVSDSENYISGIVAPSFLKAERKIRKDNVLRLTRSYNQANFILPFTEGSYSTINNRKQLINNRNLLNKLKPNFGFTIYTNPLVRVIYRPETGITSNLDLSSGRYSISIEKTGSDKVNIN